MKDKTKEWIRKASGDFNVALHNEKFGFIDQACFSYQQTAEKFLKAVVFEIGNPVSKTHKLLDVLESCGDLEDNFSESEKKLLHELSNFAVLSRYPGYDATEEDVKLCRETANLVRKVVCEWFGLEVKEAEELVKDRLSQMNLFKEKA